MYLKTSFSRQNVFKQMYCLDMKMKFGRLIASFSFTSMNTKMTNKWTLCTDGYHWTIPLSHESHTHTRYKTNTNLRYPIRYSINIYWMQQNCQQQQFNHNLWVVTTINGWLFWNIIKMTKRLPLLSVLSHSAFDSIVLCDQRNPSRTYKDGKYKKG